MMAVQTALVPTAEEIEQARVAYVKVFGEESKATPDNPMIEGRAKIHAMVRQYPEVAPLLGTMKLDAPMGFGFIDVGLPNDPTYAHVVLDVEDFLAYALAGEIALNEEGQPDYTGTDRLRG